MMRIPMTLPFLALPLLAVASPALAQDAGVSADKFVADRTAKIMSADTDKDGKISQDEWVAFRASAGGDPARAFKRIDTDADGFLSPDEIKAVMQQRFGKLDKNQDGMLTKDELTAGHAAAE
jgi:Ca2+-binding EF-hand superfamily protein